MSLTVSVLMPLLPADVNDLPVLKIDIWKTWHNARENFVPSSGLFNTPACYAVNKFQVNVCYRLFLYVTFNNTASKCDIETTERDCYWIGSHINGQISYINQLILYS